MYNLRYHIASLVGVFLALALGLILGGLVVQGGTVDRQQGALVQGLQEEYKQLRTENRELTGENQLLAAYSARVTDEWTSGRLKGRTILIVSNTGRESGAAAAAESVKSSGGSMATILLLRPGFGLDDKAKRATVMSLAPDPANPLASIAASLAAEWISPSDKRPVTDALVAAQVIRIQGDFKAGTMASGLVDVATADGKADEAGIAIAAAFGESGPSVGAQTGESAGVARAAQTAGISAFDTLGTDVGRYSLVALMTGAAPGYYGTGPGAIGLFPTE